MSGRRIIVGAWAIGALSVLSVLVGAVGGCRAPTQMTLDISYRTGMCGKGIAILAGDDPHAVEGKVQAKFYAAQTSTCDASGHVGTLVLTPSASSGNGGRGAVIVIAGISADPSTCTAANGYAGCVVARRVFAFAEHTSLSMPISLDFACENVPCSETSSCKSRQCVSSQAMCNGDVCDEYGVAPDGGPAVEPDAPTSNEAGGNDAATDAPVTMPDGGVDAGLEAGGACKLKSGLCPPYAEQSAPSCTPPPPQAKPKVCRWTGPPDSPSTSCVLSGAPRGPDVLYDQGCTSARDCPADNKYCCGSGSGSGAQCGNRLCGVGTELCVEDCDCLGTTCVPSPGASLAEPPRFIKTCSQINVQVK